jgi:hypothetical protein
MRKTFAILAVVFTCWLAAPIRTHLGLAKDTPTGRPIALCSLVGSKILSLPRVGGLHRRYAVAA